MSRRTWMWIIVVWIGVGLVDATRILLTRHAYAPDLGVVDALQWALPDALSWILLTPIPVVLARRFPIRRPFVGRDLAVHLPMAGLVGLTHVILDVLQNLAFDAAAGRAVDFGTQFGYIAPFNTHLTILTYLLIVGVTRTVDDRISLREERAHRADLQRQLVEARLRSLHARLRPHFLFNALHTGSALVGRDPDAARSLLQGLGDLLRYSLSLDDRLEVPLRDELDVTRSYLGIESARFGARLRFDVAADDAALAVLVPPFLLQPLVENAIRHGLSPRREGGVVAVRAHRHGDALRIEVIDDGIGVAGDVDAGTGLRTTRARLDVQYGSDAGLSIGPGPRGGTRVEVLVPWREESAATEEVELAHRGRG